MEERFSTSRFIALHSSLFKSPFSVSCLNLRILIATHFFVDFQYKVLTFPKVPLLDKFVSLSEGIYFGETVKNKD